MIYSLCLGECGNSYSLLIRDPTLETKVSWVFTFQSAVTAPTDHQRFTQLTVKPSFVCFLPVSNPFIFLVSLYIIIQYSYRQAAFTWMVQVRKRLSFNVSKVSVGVFKCWCPLYSQLSPQPAALSCLCEVIVSTCRESHRLQWAHRMRHFNLGVQWGPFITGIRGTLSTFQLIS